MVVKERIVVDLPFSKIEACVAKVKEWLQSKGYKKIASRNPDRWSSTVTLEIAKGGMFGGKKNIEAAFKSYMGGHSIMIEFIGSHDGQGLGGKPIIDRSQSSKDRPFQNLANEMTRFVKSTWKREAGGPGDAYIETPATQPSTMYQFDAAPTTDQSSSYAQPEQTATSYDYGTDTGYQESTYDTSGSYQTEPAPAPTPEPTPPPSGDISIPEGDISDDDLEALERQFEEEEAAASMAPMSTMDATTPTDPTPPPSTDPYVDPEPSHDTDPSTDPGPEPTHDTDPTMDPGAEPTHDTDTPTSTGDPDPSTDPYTDSEPSHDTDPSTDPGPEPTHDTDPTMDPGAEPTHDTDTPTSTGEPDPSPDPSVDPEPSHDTDPSTDPGAEPTHDGDTTPGAEPEPTHDEEPTCPNCGKMIKLTWRTCPYCEHDLTSASTDEPADTTTTTDPEAPICPTCGKPGTWIEDYNRFFCYDCEQYL